jgi:kynureninase
MANLNKDAQNKHVYSREYAVSLDAQDPLRHMSKEFFIPSKAELKSKSLPEAGTTSLKTQSQELRRSSRIS